MGKLEEVAKALFCVSNLAGVTIKWEDVSRDKKRYYFEMAEAAINAMRGELPTDGIVARFDDDHMHMTTYHCIAQSYDALLDEVLAAKKRRKNYYAKE